MTGTGDCREIRRALGVYLLGAITPADRATVDSHLARCADCRGELGGLASLPGRLASVPAADVTGMAQAEADPAGRGEGPPDLALGLLLGRAARLRWQLKWRRLAAAAAAAVLAGGGAVAVSRALYPPAQQPSATALPWTTLVQGRDSRTGAAATVSYLAEPWGLQLHVRVSGIPAGTRCVLQVIGPDGREVAAGGWTVPAGRPHPWYPASSPFPASAVRGFQVATTAGQTLVSVPVSARGAPPPAAVSGGGMRTPAAAYLAIARPANHRLETEVDGFTQHERNDISAAQADLRAEAATEHRFDQLLSKIPFPSRIAATTRALIQANERRAALTGQQARSSSASGLLSFAGRHRAADAAVEAQVRIIRRELGLPPPQTS